MKKIVTHIVKSYPKIGAAIFIITLFISIMSFMAYDKAMTKANDRVIKENLQQENVSSVLFTDGIYSIDSSLAMSGWKKEKMIELIATENLIEKKTVEDIPEFIKTFLAHISPNKTCEMANPGEAWQEGGWVNGFKKEQKNIANATCCVAKPFASKQLIYCSIGKNIALVYYYSGGIRKTEQVNIIKFKNNKVVDFWFNNPGFNFSWVENDTTGFIGSKEGIINYLKTIKTGNC